MTDPGGAASPRTEAGKRLDTAWPGTHLDRLDWNAAIRAIEAEAAQEAPAPEGLRAALSSILDYGYQPRYNGRPSCPFCQNFVDDEETHEPTCVLVAAFAPPPYTEHPVSPEMARAIEAVQRGVAKRAEARPPEGLDAARLARLTAFAEKVATSKTDTAGTRAMARYALSGSLEGVVDEARLSAGGATKP